MTALPSYYQSAAIYAEEAAHKYSRTSSLQEYSNCKYNDLYYLSLLHQLGINEPECVRILRKLERQLDGGLLMEHESLLGRGHSSDYITLHLSAMYYQLAPLYGCSRKSIEALQRHNANSVVETLRATPNQSAWYKSNIVMAYAVLFAHQEKFGMQSGICSAIIEYLDEQQDTATGLWVSDRRESLVNAMAAAFHYYPLYKYCSHRVPRAALAYDNIYKLLTPSGFFCFPAGYACLDYDGVASLHYLYHYELTDKERAMREKNFVNLMQKVKKSIESIQNSDGGFPEAGPIIGASEVLMLPVHLVQYLVHTRCLWTFAWNVRFALRQIFSPNHIMYANSIAACASTLSETNSFATWFRCMTLDICERNVASADDNVMRPEMSSGRFPLPGLGYL